MVDTKSGSAPKQQRKAQGPKPVFVVFQVLDENGRPMSFSKDRINPIIGTRNAADALDIMDGGKYEHATYKKVMVGK